MKIGIMQPTFVPWAGYFGLIKFVDKFVFLDDVQFDSRSWQQRNKIYNNNSSTWLTVPVVKKNLQNQKIFDVKIDLNSNFKKKHIKQIHHNYTKAKYFKKYITFFEELYSKDFKYLSDMNIYFIKEICNLIDIRSEFFISKNLDVDGNKSEKLINICNKLKVKKYISVEGSRNYLQADSELFLNEKIDLIYFGYNEVKYDVFYNNFYPKLSIIDIIFNCGENSKKIIIEGIKN